MKRLNWLHTIVWLPAVALTALAGCALDLGDMGSGSKTTTTYGTARIAITADETANADFEARAYDLSGKLVANTTVEAKSETELKETDLRVPAGDIKVRVDAFAKSTPKRLIFSESVHVKIKDNGKENVKFDAKIKGRLQVKPDDPDKGPPAAESLDVTVTSSTSLEVTMTPASGSKEPLTTTWSEPEGDAVQIEASGSMKWKLITNPGTTKFDFKSKLRLVVQDADGDVTQVRLELEGKTIAGKQTVTWRAEFEAVTDIEVVEEKPCWQQLTECLATCQARYQEQGGTSQAVLVCKGDCSKALAACKAD